MKLIDNILKPEIALHIEKLQQNLKEAGQDAVLIGGNTNIYYLTGRFFRGFVFVPVEGKPIYFVVKPTVFEKEDIIEYVRKPEQIPDIFQNSNITPPNNVGLEYDDLSYSEITRLTKLFPNSTISNGSSTLKKTRMIKTDWEIAQIAEDGVHQSNVYAKVKKCYKQGMSDLDLQIEIEYKLRLEGSLGVSRVAGNLMEINMGSVISGENADTPGPYEFTMTGAGVDSSLPVGADNSPILEGQTVMIDMNGAFNGYQSDMTRVWSLGLPSPLAIKAHNCSIKILRELERLAVPGVPVSALYSKAIEIVENEGLQDYFMGHKSQVSFIGHGVGIELNEMPVVNARSKDNLQRNMTIALEPKFVIPHVGAVGVENTYQVTEAGLKNLTPFPEPIQPLI